MIKWLSEQKWFTLLYIILSLTLLAHFSISARELCRAQLDCPPDFDGDTVIVGYDAVMLSEIFEHCAPDSVKEGIVDTLTDTISLFLIIDHSSSMSIMDPNSNRFRVAEEIIDSVYAESPASEIGIAVFSNRLMHNFNDDTFFDQLDNSQTQGWNDSYIPLTRLDTQVGSISAVEKLKWAISLDDTAHDPGGNLKLLQADYETSGRRKYTGGTDISIPFEAAKEAFTKATCEKKRQFIVFISDGIHQLIDVEREPYSRDYITGANTPTTYTAFFVNQGQPIPDQIDTMTTNIQNNGYSDNNYSSTVWSTEAQEQKFIALLFNNIIGDGLKEFTSSPVMMVINGDTTTTFDDTFAIYDAPLAPFNKNGELALDVSYTWHWNAPINKDVTENYSIYIMQGPTPDLESVDCWNQGRILFYDSLGTPIFVAGPEQNILEVRFFPPDSGNYPPMSGNTVDLELKNAAGTDVLNLTLTLVSTYYSAKFYREYGTPKIDGILQNSNTDSIIATYRNTVISLDTVRTGIPVMPKLDLTVADARYKDMDADGHPDVVRTTQSGGQVLSTDDCIAIKPYTSITSPRNVGAPTSLVPASYGFDINIPEPIIAIAGKTDLFKTTNGAINERVSMNTGSIILSSGNSFPFTDTIIQDGMAPVINSATYYDYPGLGMYDTLKIIFSEDAGSITNINPFSFYRPSNGVSYLVNLTWVRTDSNVVVFAAIPTVNQTTPLQGDSIRINPTALVADLAGNTQENPLNIRRLLTYYYVITINSVMYLDTSSNPDGFIDIISVITNVVPDSALLSSLLSNIALADTHNFTITGIQVTDSGFNIIVTSGTEFPITSVDPDKDSLWITNDVQVNNNIIFITQKPVKDGIPPVLIKLAKFTPKLALKKGIIYYDTLQVTFSEKVHLPPYKTDHPFQFKSVIGNPYVMYLTPLSQKKEGIIQTYLVKSLTIDFPNNDDLVSIDSSASITDLAGNVQDDPNNKPVPLKVMPFKFILNINITTNPGDFLQTFTVNGITGTGIGIIVSLVEVSWPDSDPLTGEMMIFDAVGNLVSEPAGIPMADKSGFVFTWNGYNKNLRKISNGAYLCYIIIKSSNGYTKKDRVMIGVKSAEN